VGWANHHHYSLRSNNNAIIMYSFRSLTIQHLSVFLFTLLLLASCSSDPCEEVTCLNGGTCDDGSCDCPDGWTGTDCSVYDFDYVGDYTAKTLTFADCNDASEEGSLQADANDRFCFNAANNSRNCSRLVLELNQDNSALFIIINTKVNGSIESSNPTRITGTYTTDAEAITFTDSSGNRTQFTVNEDRSGLTWVESTVASTGCNLVYTFIK